MSRRALSGRYAGAVVRRHALGLALATIVAGCACSAEPRNGRLAESAPGVSRWDVVVQSESAPPGPGTGHANLSASDQGVILSWIERRGQTSRLQFAERTAAGWSAPATVAAGDDWFVSYADPPQVIYRPDGSLVAAWLRQIDPRLEASNLMVSHSSDEGRSWSTAISPHQDGTTQQHAFPSFFDLPAGGLGVVWLDGREIELDQTSEAGGAMGLRFGAFNRSWERGSEAVVDARVCECCSTAAAITADGPIVAYRGRSANEVREISVSRFENGQWTPGVVVHDGGWRTLSCPVNGPAVSARERLVAVAWFTAKDGRGEAFMAFSRDAGRTWGAPIRVDDGESIGRVDIELLDERSAAVTWVGFADGRSRLFVRRVDLDGSKSAAFAVSDVPGGSTSGFPRLARWRDRLVFAWAESDNSEGSGTTRVRLATAGLP